ncbi:hypothetical protein evm_005234 [Chilo suppressalis]|nr:hypothetical protein evm_005234 [Chilo suppressalis]
MELLKDDSPTRHINVRSRTIKQPSRLKKIFILLVIAILFGSYFFDTIERARSATRSDGNGTISFNGSEGRGRGA